jgi:hypothetical protein
MSMAINRISAGGVAAMLYPVTRPSRVPKIVSGRSNSASAPSPATQNASRPQSADRTNTAEQVHAAFEYARAALSSGATMGTPPESSQTQTGQATPSTASVQSGAQPSGGVQQTSGFAANGQAGSAYAQDEQQAGQTLDITA